MRNICSVDECGRVVAGRGLCSRHYYKAKREGSLDQIAPKVLGACPACGKPLDPDRVYGSKFCNDLCKEADRRARVVADTMQRRDGRICEACGGQIPPDRNLKATTCSKVCNDKVQNRKKKEAREASRPDRSQILCPECGKRVSPKRRYGSKYCSERCKKAAHDKRWRERAPGYMRQYLYDLSEQDYEAWLLWQADRCRICWTAIPGGKGGWHVDHDHATGKIRGLLCNKHNQGLGLFDDDPALLRAAADYIEDDRRRHVQRS